MPTIWRRLVEDLCDDDRARCGSAEDAALRSLEARKLLWDGFCERLDELIVEIEPGRGLS